MLRRKTFFMLAIFVCSLYSVKCQNDTTQSEPEDESADKDLGAVIINPVKYGPSIHHLLNSLVGVSTRKIGESQIHVSPEEEEDEEEEEEEEEEEGRDSLFSFGIKMSKTDAPVTDIQNETSNIGNVSSMESPDVTPIGVDPDDPEEIARKKFYAHKETFSKIVDINNHLHTTNLLEGDMKTTKLFRNAAGGSTWPKTKYGKNRGLVIIPYKMSNKYNTTHRATVRSGMAVYAKHTCVRFVPRRTQLSYIFISDGRGCWAYVGKTGYSAQTVSLGIPGCVSKGIVMHELMHAVGFQHEHSRSDRDRFVKILHNNIQGEMDLNFAKYNKSKNLVIYDYNSIMHYSKTAFSKQPYLPSIQVKPKRNPEPSIGQRSRLSPYDIEEVKYLYNCEPGSYKRCGRDFINQQGGSFQSPNYPSAYPKESHCVWNITAKSGRYIKVTFKNINIHDSPLCQSDAILIHDGINAASPVLKTICGSQSTPVEVVSTGRTLFIMFSSDTSRDSNTGFTAVFRETTVKGTPTPPTVYPTLPPISRKIRRFQCNFERGTCGMPQDKLDQLDWLRTRGPTPSRDTGPPGDHTTRKGYYIFVESSLPATAGDNAIIRTPWLKRTFRFCVSFAYHMLGSYMGGLRLYAYEKRYSDNYGHEVLLWEKYGNQGAKWKVKDFTYSPRKNVEAVQFYWEAFVFFYQSDIALDDLRVAPGACSTQNPSSTLSPVSVWTNKPTYRPPTSVMPPTPPKVTTTVVTTTTPSIVYSRLNCTFENDLCQFTQSQSDNFDWIRHSGSTPSASTGPTSDHTTGGGYYMYVEASSPRRLGHVARLESPYLTPSQHCLRMWYHMFGKQTGKLRITKVVDGVSTIVDEKKGDSGNHWHSLEIDLNSLNVRKNIKRNDVNPNQGHLIEADEGENDIPEPEVEAPGDSANNFANDAVTTTLPVSPNMKLIIEASIGRGYAGDIAIDDIFISDQPCEDSSTHIASTPLLNNFSCDFEATQSMCGFKQVKNDDFDWLSNSGTTGSSGTGPPTDNTKKSSKGVYIYIESSSPRRVRDKARIVTPKMLPGQYCVSFATHMYGSSTGQLQVFTKEEDSSGVEGQTITRWMESGNRGNSWHLESFSFTSDKAAQSVSFIFEATVGTSFTSDIALDDVNISRGECMSQITSTISQRTTTTTTTKKTTTTPPPTTTTTTTTKKTTTTPPPTTTTTTTTKKTTTTPPPTTTTTTTTKKTTTTPPPTTTTATTTTPPPTTTTTTTTAATTKTRRTKPTVSKNLYKSNFLKAFSCDFESEVFCKMTQSKQDKFDWLRKKDNTPSGGTGPTSDHTDGLNGTGHYLYIEGSSPRRRYDDAILNTPKLSVTTPKRCVTFWYHMWGSGMGTLEVFAEFAVPAGSRKVLRSSDRANERIFFEAGNKNRNWRRARVEVDQTQKYYGGSVQINFIGKRGTSFQSDLAIDDVCVAEGPCDANSRCSESGQLLNIVSRPQTVSTSRASTTSTTAKTTTTAFSAPTKPTVRPTDRSSNDLWSGMPLCTFDDNRLNSNQVTQSSSIPGDSSRDLGKYIYPSSYTNDRLCGWKQFHAGQDQFDWTRHRGATKSQNTGPNADHTTKRDSGYYMYTEASTPRNINDVAYLQTYTMPVSKYCFSMWYHMYGKFIGRLQVRALQKLKNGKRLLTSSMKGTVAGNQGKKWKLMQIDHTPRPKAVNVAFRLEGVIGKDYRGDIAIDDVSILPGACNICQSPNHRFTNNLNQEQTFSTGCINSDLFWVRCCSLTKEKAIYRRVRKCNVDMFTPERLNWYCNYL